MSIRKIFTDKDGRELSARINADGKLSIEIYHTISDDLRKIALDKEDSLQFIAELRKLGKNLQIDTKFYEHI